MSAVIDGRTVPAQLPRYVRNLNTWAESFGLRAEVAVYPYDNDPELRMWGRWTGTRAQLLEMVQPLPSYRLPITSGRLIVPKGSRSGSLKRLLEGNVTVSDEKVTLEIDFGSPVYTLSNHDGVETIVSAEEVLHHGSVEALIAMGVEQDRLPKGARTRREYDGLEYISATSSFKYHASWYSVVQPDGSVVHCIETPLKVHRRQAELDKEYRPSSRVGAPRTTARARPSYLRLVIDNTRPEVQS
jgi:hypothetical protein